MVVEVMRNAPQVSMCTECKTLFNNKMFEGASLSLFLSLRLVKVQIPQSLQLQLVSLMISKILQVLTLYSLVPT